MRASFTAYTLVVCVTVLCSHGAALAGAIPIGWMPVDHPSVSGYRVLHGPAHQTSFAAQFDVNASTTEATVSGLEDCVEYRISVRTLDASGRESEDPSELIVGWPRPRVDALGPVYVERGTLAYVTVEGANFREGAQVVFVGDGPIVVGVVENADCGPIRVLLQIGPQLPLGTVELRVVNPDGTFGAGTLWIRETGYGSADGDGDTVINRLDNCVDVYNPEQRDGDGDGEGDACDTDPGGLIAHWTMDPSDLNGNVLVDVTGSGNDGTVIGADPVDGFVGGALSFEGGDHVRVDYAPGLEVGPALTAAAWIRPTSYGETFGASIVDGYDRLLGGGWALQVSASVEGLRLFGTNQLTPLYSDMGVVGLARWQHVAVTYLNGEVRFYRDGQWVGTGPANHAPLVSGLDWLIGNSWSMEHAFTGTIDDLRVYDVSLRADEVADLARSGAGARCNDADGDGHPFPGHPACGTTTVDCADGDEDVHPGADEVCDDGIDQDCDGIDATCPCPDADGDGYTDAACGGSDCNDGSSAVHPGAEETCNGRDDDCDGVVDGADVCTDDGLVGHWTMDASTVQGTTLLDTGPSGHDGVIYGGATLEAGRHGEAMRFEGDANQYVKIPDHDDLDVTEAYTLAAWIRPDSFGQSRIGAVLDKHYAPEAEGYSLNVADQYGRDRELMTFGLSVQSPRYSDSRVVTTGRWQHVAVVYEHGFVTFYRDGEAVGQRTAIHDARPSSRWLHIGNNSGRSRDFDGLIDDVRIYRRALSAAEIGILAE